MTKKYNEIFHESHSFKRVTVFGSVLITVDLAKDLLTLNNDNRPIKNSIVNDYVKQMKEGHWLFSGGTISISKNGRLLDGQHRLLSIIKSQKPQTFNIQTGLEDKSFEVMDTGKNRTAGDALAVKGYMNTGHMSSVVKLLLAWAGDNFESHVRGSTHAHGKFTNLQVIEFMESKTTDVNLIQDAIKAGGRFYSKFKLLIPSTYAFFIYIFSQYNKDEAVNFFSKLSTGDDIGQDKDSAVWILRQKLINGSIGSNKLVTRDKYAMIIKAFNFYVKKRQIKRLAFEAGEGFPTVLKK